MKKIYLVGAGPGDPGLITVKGLELIKKADVIIHDRLGASKELLKNAKEGAELIYVGKRPGAHTFKQDEINDVLIKKAAEGRIVVRLKGGDPFVFGRAGEELRTIVRNDIDYEIVPGVTSAISVPELAGIPITDRLYASSFTVATGHEDPTKEEERLDYGKLNADTIVILMGIKNLPKIVGQMLKTRPPDMPLALIENGSTKDERVIVTTLGEAVSRAEEEGVRPPAIIVIGEVVRLRREFGR